MDNESLLSEVEDIIRNLPDRNEIQNETPANFYWLGRISAVLELWHPLKGGMAKFDIENIHSPLMQKSSDAYRKVLTLLHQANYDLRMKTFGPASIAIQHGSVFEYFDEIRKVIESATTEIYFIDPYLDAEFVSKYLCHVRPSVNIKLLAREKLKTLIPAVAAFSQQNNININVRSAPNFHDRYVFIDETYCYQSGASFKDGAKTSLTTITQITDAFPAIKSTYTSMWASANIEFGV